MRLEQFWENVAIGDPSDCWEWKRSRVSGGYGHFRLNNSYHYAHRVAYELTNGAIAEGLVIDHLCRNRACVNPSHLEAVTQRVNIQRGAAPYGAVRTTCKHGHDITDPRNVYTDPSGGRRCNPCAKVATAERKAARHARGLFVRTPATTCIRGHALDEKNTYVTSDGHRHCRTCGRINAREYRYRKAA